MKSIKEIREKSGLNHTRFSKQYKITTKQLQEWEEGIDNPPEYALVWLNQLVDYDLNNGKIADLHQFSPIKKKEIKELINELKQNENIVRVTVFGACLDENCDDDVALDVFIEMTKDEKPIKQDYSFNIHCNTNFSVDDTLYSNIINTGIEVYHK